MVDRTNDLPPGVTVEVWPPDRAPQQPGDWRQAVSSRAGIVWIDVEGATDWEALADALDQMGLPDYSRPMLGHVLQGVGPQDYGATEVTWYSAQVAACLNTPGRPHFLAAFGLAADVAPGPYEPPWVLVQSMHFLVGGLWLITHRQHGTASDGMDVKNGSPFSRMQLHDYARNRWARYVAPGDLAVLLLRGLVASYLPAVADLDRRLQDLQQGYIRGRGEASSASNINESEYREELLRVKWVVDGLSRSVVRLSRPATDPQSAWFVTQNATDIAAEVANVLERAEHALARQREEVRESFALIAASQASEQLTLSRKTAEAAATAEESARRFETVVQYAAAGFLLPALVAQVLGGLPAIYEHCPPLRALVVAGGTVLAGALSVLALYIYRRVQD